MRFKEWRDEVHSVEGMLSCDVRRAARGVVEGVGVWNPDQTGSGTTGWVEVR